MVYVAVRVGKAKNRSPLVGPLNVVLTIRVSTPLFDSEDGRE